MPVSDVKYALALSAAFIGGGLFAQEPAALTPPQPSANEALRTQQERFAEPEIITVKENIYVAHGFDMCNMIFVEGPDDLIISIPHPNT